MSSAPLATLAGALAAVLAVLGGRALVAAGAPARWARAPWLSHLAGALGASGVTPGAGLLRTMGAAIGVGLAAAVVLGRPALAALAVSGAAGGSVVYRRGAERRRVERVVAQLPGLAASLATALRAGLSLRQALGRVAAEAPRPARDELVAVSRELALGARVEDALAHLRERIPSRDLRLMVTTIELQRTAGGNLAGALDDLSSRLAERARLARELRGLTAQARLTAWMVGALPLAAGALVAVAAPGTLERALLTGIGLVVLVAAVALYGAGALLVHRIGQPAA